MSSQQQQQQQQQQQGYKTFGLKIGFPAGFPMKYKSIRFPDYNISVREAVNYISSKQIIPKPESYVLQISYIDGPGTGSSSGASQSLSSSTGMSAPVAGGQRPEKRVVKWMDDTAKLSSYPLGAADVVLEMRKRLQPVKVVCATQSMRLVADVSKPMGDLLDFIACKFKLSTSDSARYRLFHNNVELPTQLDIRALNIDTQIPFFVHNSADPKSEKDDPSLYNEEQDSDDDSFSGNLSLEVPAKSLVPLKEGYLKKQNRKKSYNTRYFILTDKFLFYYKSPHDRKASGIINYKEHVIRVMVPPRDAKLELIPKDSYQQNSASVHTHPGSYVIKFDTEQEMKSWNIAPFTFQSPTPAPSSSLSSAAQPVKGGKVASKAVFGVPVERSVPPGSDVPLIVTQTIDYIEKKAMDVVGIFRLSGSVNTIEQWKKQYDRGDKCDLFQENDPHAIAGLLKLYLRELPEPLLTYERYDKFIAAQSMDDLASRIKLIKHLVRSLPQTNYAILSKLMAFLGRVAQHSANNKMQIHNLSTVFGPNLIKERNSGAAGTNVQNLVEDTPIINALALSLMRDYPYIFGDKEIPEQKIYAKTLYDYNGGENGAVPEDLIFPQGVTIRVTAKSQDGWWTGEYQGKSGRFPATYVDLIVTQSPASLLRTKSNSSISKKKKFMLEMENTRTKTQDNEKLLQQLRERKEKLQNSIASLNHEKQQLAQDAATQKLIGNVNTTKRKQAIANIPKTIDILLVKYNEYKKSHDELATIRNLLLEECDQFNNNPKVKGKLESKEKELLQSKIDTVASKLDDSLKARQKSLSSKRVINDDLAELKITLTLN
ncbi:pleckstrin domain-containing protein [Heterostelium album PN500]|uniref:Pleckstrin domain-containing protein n=1 Tax=Heterostelium pallidum (strain ATCC 26659 / Pp 5 / PN500) TaxID=670386 RepID=D3BUV7_HETP5|nr:pleckstrin domain-containing protein [Heterostelium album PN500]EFA74895.1 pleckstrin domain-containing protein [Heterostelium album PN500]|eukprot:XP_020427029.1 pleckstrin domain-containing protein [Heterostelium album PN500]